jgi:Ca2+-transporting ATPase
LAKQIATVNRAMKSSDKKAWHHTALAEVLRLLDVDACMGLSSDEVALRQKKFGPNRVTARRGTPAWLKFLQQFAQPLLYVLLVASGVMAFLGEWVDASVIFGVVFVNATVGFLQESRAEKAIASLLQLVTTETTVRRDGHKLRVDAVELVPGDIVILTAGDRVPADLRLLQIRSLQVDESALTGESLPVHKHADALALDTLLADRKNLTFAGTLVTGGQGEGVVWGIGDETETGHIARLISQAVDLSTPLTRKIAQFSRL